MTNDIEAAAEQEALARVVLDKAAVLLDARAMLDARYVSLHKCAEANFRAALDRYARRTAALAHAARGGMETSDISIPCPPGVGLGCHATPPPATGEGFAGLPVAYQSSSIGAPPWDGPATGEADPDPRGEDREAVEAAQSVERDFLPDYLEHALVMLASHGSEAGRGDVFLNARNAVRQYAAERGEGGR